MLASLMLDRPPLADDRWLVTGAGLRAADRRGACRCLIGGKVYNMLQGVMTAKVVVVLGFCLIDRPVVRQPGELVQDLQRIFEVRHRADHRGRRPRNDRQPLRASLATRELAARSRWATSRCWGRSPDMPAAAAWPMPPTATSCATRAGAWAAGRRHPQRRRRAQHHAEPRGQSLSSITRHKSRALARLVALYHHRPGVRLGPGLLHGDGVAGAALAAIRRALDADGAEARLGAVADHGRRHPPRAAVRRRRRQGCSGS